MSRSAVLLPPSWVAIELATIDSGIVAVSAADAQRDRAVEARDLLEAVDDAQHELRPQPERERAQDALAVHSSTSWGSLTAMVGTRSTGRGPPPHPGRMNRAARRQTSSTWSGSRSSRTSVARSPARPASRWAAVAASKPVHPGVERLPAPLDQAVGVEQHGAARRERQLGLGARRLRPAADVERRRAPLPRERGLAVGRQDQRAADAPRTRSGGDASPAPSSAQISVVIRPTSWRCA